jgi:hypothetical protein
VIDEGQLEGHLQCARALCELSLRPRLRGLIIDENGLPAFATMLSVKNRDVRLLPCFCMCRLTVDLKARLCAQIAVDCLTALSRLSQSPLLHLKLMGVEGVGDEASYQKRADAVTKPVSVVTILQSVDLSLDPVLAPLVPCLLVPWLLSIIPGHACFRCCARLQRRCIMCPVVWKLFLPWLLMASWPLWAFYARLLTRTLATTLLDCYSTSRRTLKSARLCSNPVVCTH